MNNREKKGIEYSKIETEEIYRDLFIDFWKFLQNEAPFDRIEFWFIRLVIDLYSWRNILYAILLWENGQLISFITFFVNACCGGILLFKFLKGILGRPMPATLRTAVTLLVELLVCVCFSAVEYAL